MSAPIPADLLDGPVRVLAGPGAGKTQALVDLYAELVASGRAGRSQVLVLTFSAAAAEEIALRIDERLPGSYDESWISTFHSFCARLLRRHRPDPGRLLLSGFQEWLAMKHTLQEAEPALLGGLAPVARTDGFAQDALAFVAMLKQNQVHPARLTLLAEAAGTPRLRALAAAFSAYQARLDGAGLEDFRDLVAGAIGLLEARPDLLERYRAKFRYVLVDEFQDVDPAQFHLLRTLAPPATRPRLLVAGDPDQSIYGFRGTVPRLLGQEFPAVYGGRSLRLEGSWRCPAEVLSAAESLLRATQPGRSPRDQAGAPARPGRPEAGAPVQVVMEANGVDEAFFVAREIRRQMLEEPGLRPGDFAVLLRSTTVLSAPFEEAIRALGLPYEVRGAGALARNEVVRFLLTYLAAVARPDAPEAMERLLGSGLSGVGQRSAGRLRRYAIEEGRSFGRVVRRVMRWLRDQDEVAYPLPWGEDPAAPPAEPPPLAPAPGAAGGPPPRPAPPFVEYMSELELAALHRAVAAYYEVRRKAGRLPLAALAYAVLIDAGVMERLLALPLPAEEREKALTHLRAALEAFRELEEVWGRLHGRPPLLADVEPRLESLVARAVDDSQPSPRSREAVQVMTVHQAKGLQFEVVFLGGFADGLFPLAGRPHPVLEEADQRWLEANLEGFQPAWPAGSLEHQAEEARLAYVGMTRARRRLFVTYAQEYDSAAGASPFIEPALAAAPHSELSRAGFQVDERSLLTTGEAETLLAGARLDARESARLAELGIDLRFVTDPASGQSFEPYLARPAGVDPPHFSATALNDYLKCPRLYFYNHHPGLVAAPRGVEMERGSFLHTVLEEFHSRENEWRGLSPEAQRDWLDAVLERHLGGYLERQEAVLERKAEAQEVRRILGNYIRFATSSQPIRRLGTLAVESKFTLDLAGAEIHGKIDRINDTGEGTCEVVDYKTGRGRPAGRAYESYFGSDLEDVQLLMYYLACREGVDAEGRPIALRPRFLSLWYPKDLVYGRMRQVLFAVGEPAPGVREWMQRTVGEDDLRRGREVIAGAVGRIRAGDFAPAPRETLGTCLSWFGCAHEAVCPFGGHPSE